MLPGVSVILLPSMVAWVGDDVSRLQVGVRAEPDRCSTVSQGLCRQGRGSISPPPHCFMHSSPHLAPLCSTIKKQAFWLTIINDVSSSASVFGTPNFCVLLCDACTARRAVASSRISCICLSLAASFPSSKTRG